MGDERLIIAASKTRIQVLQVPTATNVMLQQAGQ